MTLNLRGLTCLAFLARAMNVTLEAVPDETGKDSSLCWFDSRMRESMYGLKNAFGPSWRDDWSVFSGRNVAENGGIAKCDLCEAEASVQKLSSDFFRICLVFGKLVVIDGGESDCRKARCQ